MDYTSVPPCEIANQRPSSKWPKVVAALATSLVIAVGVVCCILYSSRMKTDSSAMLNMVELPKGVCAVTEADRVNCGHSGITEAACVSRQCCWIKSNSDGPSCFKHAGTPKPASNLMLRRPALNTKMEPSCDVSPGTRQECGHSGIRNGTCVAIGCCWQPTEEDEPWCFKPTFKPVTTCTVVEDKRVECGHSGTTDTRCKSLGCCWKEAEGDFPWCFEPAPDTCAVDDKDKQECGFSGITQNHCEARGCCWQEANDDAPFCYHRQGAVLDSSTAGSEPEPQPEPSTAMPPPPPPPVVESSTQQPVPPPIQPTATGLGPLTCDIDEDDRQDCGKYGSKEADCEAAGCCWGPAGEGSTTPWCYFKGHSGGPVKPSCFRVSAGDLSTAPFSPSEVSIMTNLFTANINVQGCGAVAASPDHSTPGGDYFFHWARDGALTMDTLMYVKGIANSSSMVEKYAQFVAKAHTHSDPNNDVIIEPKFSIPDGEPYTGGWCRPQIDGPGLEAVTLINYANWKLESGDRSFVTQYLWTDGSYRGGIIKANLDLLTSDWKSAGCDLWEEVRSDDFFWNRMAYHKAFTLGAKFAAKMGDSTRASSYASVASDIKTTLMGHWTGKFVYESSNRQKDSSVIIAFNDGYTDLDPTFAPTSEYVAATIDSYNKLFCNEYAINKADTTANIGGVLYGRYSGDSYAGGNPWHLLTAGLAQLLYRAASEARKTQQMPSDTAMKIWTSVLAQDSFASANEFADMLARGGDGVMERIRHHIEKDGFHCAEQISRSSGEQVSAKDLTWSYAGVLKAVKAREEYMALRG